MLKHKKILGILMVLLALSLTACQGFIRVREVDGGYDIDLGAQGDSEVIPPTGGDTIIQQQQQDGVTTNEFIQSNWILILGLLLVFTIVIVALTRDRRGYEHRHNDHE